MNKKRPVNLDIATIQLPITAYVSILHRISGVVLFVGVLILMCMLDQSLSSETSFKAMQEQLSQPIAQFILWAILAALAYHLIAGIRHLVMDMGIGETLEGGRLGAKLVVFFAALLMIAAGGWILW